MSAGLDARLVHLQEAGSFPEVASAEGQLVMAGDACLQEALTHCEQVKA